MLFYYYAQINMLNTVVNFIVSEKYQKLVVQLSSFLEIPSHEFLYKRSSK